MELDELIYLTATNTMLDEVDIQSLLNYLNATYPDSIFIMKKKEIIVKTRVKEEVSKETALDRKTLEELNSNNFSINYNKEERFISLFMFGGAETKLSTIAISKSQVGPIIVKMQSQKTLNDLFKYIRKLIKGQTLVIVNDN